ncbi:MAG TPA: hypothetical protein VKP04_08155, partial [Ktedonobacteraceae bacterium]|nr:hypothetical protein [Ktedonobacteraceae bacterium]
MTYLIVHLTPIVSTLTSISNPVASQPDYSLATLIVAVANLIFMIIYVTATIVLVINTSRQSKAAIDAVHEQIKTSELQSKAAIGAVYEQIKTSELQSKAAIDAVHEQIK